MAEELTPLRKYQLVELQIFKEFIRVCEENNLKWFACWGTLLGAVRHKGFIPWDDDVDVCMPVDDYMKFRKLAIGGGLSEGYYFQSHGTNVCNQIYQQRIGLTNTTSLPRDYADVPAEWGVCIDIYPLAPAPAFDNVVDSKKFEAAARRFDQLASRYYYKKEAQLYGGLRRLYCKFMSRGTDEAHLKKWTAFERDFLAGIGYKNKTCYSASPGRFTAASFDETIELQFEDIMVKAPAGYDLVLTELYGADYMEMPSEEKRVCHSAGVSSDTMIVSLTEPWTKFMTC